MVGWNFDVAPDGAVLDAPHLVGQGCPHRSDLDVPVPLPFGLAEERLGGLVAERLEAAAPVLGGGWERPGRGGARAGELAVVRRRCGGGSMPVP
jgi:hypothetical protein